MKKFLLISAISLFSVVLPCFALQSIELCQGTDYFYFSNSKIKSIKSNNPDIISAQRISTIRDDEQQILFSAKRIGKAEIQIQTEKGLVCYSIEIKNQCSSVDSPFVELDIPGISE